MQTITPRTAFAPSNGPKQSVFAQWLVALRRQMQYTQAALSADLARRVAGSRVSPHALNRWENSQCFPNPGHCAALAEILKMPLWPVELACRRPPTWLQKAALLDPDALEKCCYAILDANTD